MCLTPVQHVQALLLSTWTVKVASQVRKCLSDLENVCVPLSQMTRHLLPFEKALVLQQQLGAFFSGELTTHIDGQAATCRYCGESDSRIHRLRWCPRAAAWGAVFPTLMQQWDELPDYTTAFGFISEPDAWHEWQAWLDTFSLPEPCRSDSAEIQVFYTDGACLFPRHSVVRVASGAALRAHTDGIFQVIWHGILPGSCQTIFRAELMAVSCALGSVQSFTRTPSRSAVLQLESWRNSETVFPQVCHLTTGIFVRSFFPWPGVLIWTLSELGGSRGMSIIVPPLVWIRFMPGSTTGWTLLLRRLWAVTSRRCSSTW